MSSFFSSLEVYFAALPSQCNRSLWPLARFIGFASCGTYLDLVTGGIQSGSGLPPDALPIRSGPSCQTSPGHSSLQCLLKSSYWFISDHILHQNQTMIKRCSSAGRRWPSAQATGFFMHPPHCDVIFPTGNRGFNYARHPGWRLF